MAHELAFRAGRAQMAYTGGRTPWHGLGQNLPAGATIEDWTIAAGMDYRVLRTPVIYRIEEGEEIEINDRHVLYRSDTSASLGIVSDGYEILQPAAVVEFFRDLVAEAGFTMETAGVLFDGRKYWALARTSAGSFVMDRQDEVRPYLLLSTSADGSMATEARLTTVCVVCNNTLSMAVREAKAAVRVTHRTSFDADAAKAQLGITAHQAQARFDETMDQFRALARAPLRGFDMVQLTLRAFGHNPDKMDRDALTKAAQSRGPAMVGQAAHSGRGLQGAHLQARHGTAWAWLNAVTQYADHAAKARSPSHRLDSAWFGPGDKLKQRAMQLAVEYVGAGGSALPTRYEDGGGLLDDVLAETMRAA